MHFVTNRTNDPELAQFASFFHQDFGLELRDPAILAVEYVQQLVPERSAVLKVELEELLRAWPGRDGRALRYAWIRAGAQWSPRNPRPFLEQALAALGGSQ